ncbi:uncharacterized protein LOC144121131 [Amblyomma americanum]
MAIRRKKPGQPARPPDHCVQPQCTKTNRVCKSYVQPSNQFTAASTRLRQQHRNDGREMPKSSPAGTLSLTESSEHSSPADCTVHKGDENRSENPTLTTCKGDSVTGGDNYCGKGSEPGEGSASAEESVCRLQNRLRDNWSKLVTDRITMMAFARSLKGHKCPTFLYCQS